MLEERGASPLLSGLAPYINEVDTQERRGNIAAAAAAVLSPGIVGTETVVQVAGSGAAAVAAAVADKLTQGSTEVVVPVVCSTADRLPALQVAAAGSCRHTRWAVALVGVLQALSWVQSLVLDDQTASPVPPWV